LGFELCAERWGLLHCCCKVPCQVISVSWCVLAPRREDRVCVLGAWKGEPLSLVRACCAPAGTVRSLRTRQDVSSQHGCAGVCMALLWQIGSVVQCVVDLCSHRCTDSGQIVSICQQLVMRPCSKLLLLQPTHNIFTGPHSSEVCWVVRFVHACNLHVCFCSPWACDRTPGLLQGCVDTPGASLQHYFVCSTVWLASSCSLVAVNHRSALLLLCCVVPAG
jgi:hypothetical protein